MRAIERFEQALAQTPDDTRVLFALGNTARALGLARPAEEFFRRVLTLEPGRVEAVVNLANLLRSHGNFESAEALLLPALSRNPESAEIWLTLGSLYGETGDLAQAAEHYRKALALRPDYAPALGNLADLLADDGDLHDALALYDRALRAEPGNAQARVNRGVLHLLHGNLKEGWRDYAARLNLGGKVPKPDHNLPRWTGSVLKRERLLMTAEQGVGDQIMFASMIPQLQDRAQRDGGSLILECEPRLVIALCAILSFDHGKSVGRGDARRYDDHALRLAQIRGRRDLRHRNGQRAAILTFADRNLSDSEYLSHARRGRSGPLASRFRRWPRDRHLLAKRQDRRTSHQTICAVGEVGRFYPGLGRDNRFRSVRRQPGRNRKAGRT